MDDRSNKAYASLPERLYVVQDGQVVYQVRLLIVIRFLLLLLLSYALLPERLYVVQDGKVVYQVTVSILVMKIVMLSLLLMIMTLSQGGLGPFDYRISDVENFLKKSK